MKCFNTVSLAGHTSVFCSFALASQAPVGYRLFFSKYLKTRHEVSQHNSEKCITGWRTGGKSNKISKRNRYYPLNRNQSEPKYMPLSWNWTGTKKILLRRTIGKWYNGLFKVKEKSDEDIYTPKNTNKKRLFRFEASMISRVWWVYPFKSISNYFAPHLEGQGLLVRAAEPSSLRFGCPLLPIMTWMSLVLACFLVISTPWCTLKS